MADDSCGSGRSAKGRFLRSDVHQRAPANIVGIAGPRRFGFSGDLEIVTMDKRDAPAFEDSKVPVRFKLFALWTSAMFFYIYGDYFELFQPGKLQDMFSGRTPLGAM